MTTWLITGCSTGLGRALAQAVLAHGHNAAVTARNVDADDADVGQLFDTNLFGAVDMIKAVLLDMRAKRAGAIVNISSIGACISPPGSGYYSATKAALEGLSGSLHKELQPLGISVMAIEPGAFRTDFAGRSLTSNPLTRLLCWSSAGMPTVRLAPSPMPNGQNWTNGALSLSTGIDE